MGLMVECAKPDALYLSMLTEYARNRVEESPNSLCTAATFKWLSMHFGIRVTEEGEAKHSRDWSAKGFTSKTFEAARQMPWDKLAKELAFKIPSDISWSSAASSAAKLEHAGTPLPSEAEVYAAFKAAVKSYKDNDKFLEWVKEYTKQEAKAA
jgi:hypothetical protein